MQTAKYMNLKIFYFLTKSAALTESDFITRNLGWKTRIYENVRSKSRDFTKQRNVMSIHLSDSIYECTSTSTSTTGASCGHI